MISNFSIFPGEVFLGALTRYAEHHRMFSANILMWHLFGKSRIKLTVDLPCMLGTFAEILPPQHLINAESLLMQHTAYPYVTAFMNSDRRASIREAMINGTGQGVRGRAGVTTKVNSLSRRLRFCPMCAQCDIQRYGSCYWHVLHQLSPVLVCPQHDVWLKESELAMHSNSLREALIPADSSLAAVSARPIDPDSPTHILAQQFARDVAWLLTHPVPIDTDINRDQYRNVLTEQCLALYHGGVNIRRLEERFHSIYSNIVLTQFGITLQPGTKLSWLARMFRVPQTVLHPIYHLMIIHALGMNAETFFSQRVGGSFFGDGPWPCLNPVCRDYYQLVIMTCRTEYCRSTGSRPRGIFACHCGYTYMRTGPDRDPNDRFRKTKIEKYGPIWEQALRVAWNDPLKSITVIATEFHTAVSRIKYHAERLQLSFDRAYKIVTPLIREDQGRRSVDNKLDKLVVTDYTSSHGYPTRATKESYPSTTLKEQKQEIWNSIWRTRDRRLARQISTTAKTIRSELGRPVQITFASIARRLGILSILRHHIMKLPRTKRVLEKVAESRQAYAIRRLRWAASSLLQQGQSYTRSQLLNKANAWRYREDPSVQRVITELCVSNCR